MDERQEKLSPEAHEKLSPEAHQVLVSEFEQLSASFIANEQTGDTRVNLFVAAAAAVLAAFGFTEKSGDLIANPAMRIAPLLALVFLLVLGWYTLNRMVRRNL